MSHTKSVAHNFLQNTQIKVVKKAHVITVVIVTVATRTVYFQEGKMISEQMHNWHFVCSVALS